MDGIWQTINEFLSGSGAQTVYWICALVGSAVFAFTGAMHIFGLGGVSGMSDDGMDADMDGDIDIAHPDTGFLDFKLISLRTLLAFVMMFGWGGVVFGKGNGIAGFIGAFACGFVTMLIVAALISLILKLQQSGTQPNSALIGKTGTVYLSIPEKHAGFGKVMVNTGSGTREVAASSDTPLPTGTPVKVVALAGSRRFIVEKI